MLKKWSDVEEVSKMALEKRMDCDAIEESLMKVELA
jgi:hypothetical protein